MRKLIILAAMLAMVIVAAVPALAASNGNNNPFDNNNNHHHPFNNNDNGGISQANEQDVESGDSSQTFNVTGGGDNSNSCQGIQGVSNTGNAVQNTSVLQYGSPDSGAEVDDSGNFTISPSSSTSCNQQVNQAASASGS